MANVLFRYSPELSILVVRLQGTLLPTQGHSAPSFNDSASFVLATDAAEVRMSTAQLAGLMNSWLLSSPHAQIKDVRIGIAGNQLLIDGTMKKGIHVPFHSKADLATTPSFRALLLHLARRQRGENFVRRFLAQHRRGRCPRIGSVVTRGAVIIVHLRAIRHLHRESES